MGVSGSGEQLQVDVKTELICDDSSNSDGDMASVQTKLRGLDISGTGNVLGSGQSATSSTLAVEEDYKSGERYACKI